MNVVEGTSPVPLTVFGGAVTEMSPEDLPEGASPFNEDCDFVPGAVFQRGGRQSVYSFSGLFAEDLAGFAISTPGFHSGETPWASPANATKNIPGTYASVTLNFGGGGGAIPILDGTPVTAGLSSAINPGTISISGAPSTAGEWALFACSTNSSVTPPPTNFTNIQNNAHDNQSSELLSGTSTINPTLTAAGQTTWSAVLAFFFTNGLTPVAANVGTGNMASVATVAAAFPSNLTPTKTQVCVASGRINSASAATLTISDTQLNTWTQIANIYTNGQALNNRSQQIAIWVLTGGATAAADTVTVGGLSLFDTGIVTVFEVTNLAPGAQTAAFSQILQASNFNFNIPTTEAILGAQIEVLGHQTTQPADAILTGNLLLGDGTISTKKNTGQLPLVDGQLNLGSSTEVWSLQLTPAIINNPNFAVQLVASAATLQTFSIYAIKVKVFTSPTPGSNFDYVKTYEQTSGQIDTLALDANGVLWDENVTSAPGILNALYTGILPNTYAKSVTFNNVEYIALSNLLNGTDIPRHWDGSNLDRVSQVGPGAPPSVNATSTIFQIAPAPNGVTQLAAVSPFYFPAQPTGFGFLLWSAGPGSTQSGNTITFYYSRVVDVPNPDATIIVGQGIRIQGCPALNGQTVNGNYIVTSVGSGIPPNGNFDHVRFYFTVTATSTQSATFFTNNSGIVGSTYQVTLATLTTLTPLPNVQVGSQITVAGVGVPAWNATWTVLATPNAAQMSITQTQLSLNVATYTFTLISGVAPTVGQQVTIVGCLNGPIVGGTSIFNISNGIVSSVGANQFSISITGPNVNPAAESGNATVNGTKFQFDPGIQDAGTGTNPIFGNSGGGTIVIGGAGLGAGTRKAVLLFLTRNGLITAPSPPVIFNTTGGSTSLAFSNILIGPSDTIARIIALTGAGGNNFFWIPVPVITQTGGQTVTYTSSIINDNTSTTAVLTFTDAVLLSGLAIDISGNNLFELLELGSCRGFLTYSNRLIAWGEQNKIQNLINLSFEGGIAQSASGVTTYPAGWTVDPTNGAGGNLQNSAVFGNSYYIQNTTGGVQALYGMLTQAAFQDPYLAPIVLPNTTYSARITARCPSGVQTGSFVVDFFSPLQNRIFGSFTIPLSSMSSNFQIFTGTLLTATFKTVPADLVFRIYAANLPNNGDVEIDRVEPFPTLAPVISTQFTASYAGNQEAFDQLTGRFGPAQNQQPINGAFVQNELLYALKEKSMYSTSDNGVTEPFKWSFREVSPKVGTAGIHSYDTGEGWMITACRPGLYFFEGGEPSKLSQEIQPVWDLINWTNPTAAASIWVRNDEDLKRITIGVPIPTPNPYMPEFPVNANPTTPNVILMCSYRELNTGPELQHTGPIRATFSGRLMSPEPARKWSFWNMACPYADLVSRGGEEWREFFCTGYQNSKIFQLSSAQLDDDGTAINSFYVTYGFVKPEMADAKGLGLHRMTFDVLTMILVGTGTAKVQVYPESVQNPLPFPLDPVTLQAFSQGDVEVSVNITGNRFFVRVGSNTIGNTWRLSKVVAALKKDPWAELRGTQVGSA